MRTHKHCPVCNRTMLWEAFGQDLSQSIGIKGLCKECFNSRTRQRYAARTEDQKAARRLRDRAAYARRRG